MHLRLHDCKAYIWACKRANVLVVEKRCKSGVLGETDLAPESPLRAGEGIT